MITLHNTSCEKLINEIEAGTVDLVLTDPPYPREFLPCWSELSKFASHALKPGGILLAMSGQCHLPEVLDRLREQPDLIYHWTISYRMTGNGGKGGCIARNIYQNDWKPFLWFRKDGKPIPKSKQIQDSIASIQADKRFHYWGQSEEPFIYLIEKFCNPGSLVVDPFLGGGTTAIAAELAGCNFIGADIDKECIEITERRLKSIQLRLF